jgi:hypothetical protein
MLRAMWQSEDNNSIQVLIYKRASLITQANYKTSIKYTRLTEAHTQNTRRTLDVLQDQWYRRHNSKCITASVPYTAKN